MINSVVEFLARTEVRARIYQTSVGIVAILTAVGLLTDANADLVMTALAALGGGAGALAAVNTPTSSDNDA
ncbi:hypothetical protein [Salininema proteolyticum]|uniref:Holin n=1 Tax=Salininema proteolyticum TaxID=1607685 RepID=A0ABV8TTK2_9ACTN